jgi:hypothetical protein
VDPIGKDLFALWENLLCREDDGRIEDDDLCFEEDDRCVWEDDRFL